MACLNPYAPLFVPAVEAPQASAHFLSPFSGAYGYPCCDALPQPMCPLPWGLLPAEVLPIPTLVPAPVHQLLLCYCYYCYRQHELGVNSGFPFPWPADTFVGVTPFLLSPEVSLPFYPAFPIPQEGLRALPHPAWHPSIHPVQPGMLDSPSTPLLSQIPGGSPPHKAVVLRKRRVKFGPRRRVKMDNKNGSGADEGKTAGGVVGMARRAPKRIKYRGLSSLWVPKLRCYRKKPPEEAKLYQQFQFKSRGGLEGSGRGDTLSGVEDDDARTTVMVKNIPNKLRKETLLDLLDRHCFEENEKVALHAQLDNRPAIPSQFNFFYLPIDFGTGNNLGYAFVNFTSAAAARRLYHALHQTPWSYLGSKKVCEVTYARIQGLPVLLKHFRSATFSCDCHDVLPVYFVPHRDGTFKGRCFYVGKLVPRRTI